MPSAERVMANWCVDMTWTPDPALYAPKTRTLQFKQADTPTGRAYLPQMALAATQDMNAKNPVTLSAPYLDPDQSW